MPWLEPEELHAHWLEDICVAPDGEVNYFSGQITLLAERGEICLDVLLDVNLTRDSLSCHFHRCGQTWTYAIKIHLTSCTPIY